MEKTDYTPENILNEFSTETRPIADLSYVQALRRMLPKRLKVHINLSSEGKQPDYFHI